MESISVLGFPINSALEVLEKKGFKTNVVLYEAPNTKGSEIRVIRETISDGNAMLIVSRFKTEVLSYE